MNAVELQGCIQKIFVGNRVTIITLFIQDAKKNYPQIAFFGADRKQVEGYETGDFVNITGAVKVRVKKDPSGYFYREQSIRGFVISPLKTEMTEKFGKPLGGHYEFKNEILIEGTITTVKENHGIVGMLVKPDEENFTIWISNYTPDQETFLEKHKPGSRICAKCMIQTNRKEKDGVAHFFENVVSRYSEIEAAE